MFASAPRPRSTGELSASSPWSNVLKEMQSQISSGRARAAKLDGPPPLSASRAAARAHSRLLVALEGGSRNRGELASELVEDAVQLIVAIAQLGTTGGRSGEDERARLIDQLRRCLNAHENSVLAGEVTYGIRLEDGEAPAARARRAMADSSGGGAISQADLISLRIASVDLAALLVRAAANLTIAGSAHAAPEPRSPALDRSLRAVAAEIDACARATERPVDARGDVVAHQLAAGLRVLVANETIDELAVGALGGTIDAATLDSARSAWLRLATCEYLAVSTLAGQLEEPTHDPRLGSLADAIEESAANVLCGARLIGRAGAFRHRPAWRHQTIGLTYALEAYIAGIRGHTPSIAQAHLIALTRLARAIAAITSLDLCRSAAPSDDGSRDFS